MAHSSGWIIDVSVKQNRAIIWIKTIEGGVLRLTDVYQPNFYLLPTDENTSAHLFQILDQQPIVKNVWWEEKFTDLFGYNQSGTERIICVNPESILGYKTLLKSLKRDPRVAQLFNTDLSHIQQYLFMKLKIEPTSKVEVQFDNNQSRLIKIIKINEYDDELAAAPPPFSIMHFEIHTISSSYNLGPHDLNDPITRIRARYQQEPEIVFGDSEDSILKDFSDYVLAKDPDILVSSNQHPRRSTILDYLFGRMRELGLDLQLGRDKKSSKTNKIEGRVYLSSISFHAELDLAGLIEKARFGYLPLGLAARYGKNRLVDSRNCYELIQGGFVISRSFNNQERIRTLDEIIAKDKGSMIFSPHVGLHENVVVLDYENEHANLILKHNLSYETVTSTDDGIIMQNRKDKPGLLPTVLQSVLNRRIFFKNLQKSFLVNTNEWQWCEHGIVALKDILVSLYGTTGSFWNRFANVTAFEKINRLSREVLIKKERHCSNNGI